MSMYYSNAKRRDHSGAISHVTVYSDSTKSWVLTPRQDVIRSINSGNTHVTYIYRNGGYVTGSQIHVYDGRFLRTDRNRNASDNLDELPDC